MNSKDISSGILKAIASIIGGILVLYFIYKIQSVIVYVVISAVISLIGLPIVRLLKKRLKFNNTLAVVVTIVFIMGLVFSLIGLFIPLIVEQGQNLSLLNIEELRNTFQSVYEKTIAFFLDKNIEFDQRFNKNNLFSKIDFSIIPDFLNSAVSGLGSFSIALFSIIFISFFFLKDSKLLGNAVLTFVPTGKEEGSQRSMNKIKDLLSRYFIGLIFQILILFVIYTSVLLIFGVKNAVVIAFLCALLNLIPYVGPMIGGILMIFLTMSNFIGSDFQAVMLPKTIFVFIGFLVGQLVDNFFSQPIIFSKSVKSHPLEIFLIISIAGLLFGVIGLIIAVPAYTSIKVILKEFLSDNKIVQQLTKDL